MSQTDLPPLPERKPRPKIILTEPPPRPRTTDFLKKTEGLFWPKLGLENLSKTLSRQLCRSIADLKGPPKAEAGSNHFPKGKTSSSEHSRFLALPAEIRVQIFREVLVSGMMRGIGATLLLANLPWTQSPKPTVLAIFLISKRLHGEAEEAMWSHFAVLWNEYDHYKYPTRPSVMFTLSPYAYAHLSVLYMPLHVRKENHFARVRAGWNAVVGDTGSKSTWRFEAVLRKMPSLRKVKVMVPYNGDIANAWLAPNQRWRGQVVEALVNLIGVFDVESLTVMLPEMALLEEVRAAARWRVIKAGSVEWVLDKYEWLEEWATLPLRFRLSPHIRRETPPVVKATRELRRVAAGVGAVVDSGD